MKSAPFVSPNFLERVAEPGSPLHADYLACRRSEITRAELINRLPHVAMLGDSGLHRHLHLGAVEHVVARAHVPREELVSSARRCSKNLQYFEKLGDDHAFCRDRMRRGWCARG
jgi:hypothetical protein